MVATRESVALAERIIAETADKDRVADGRLALGLGMEREKAK
jgi:hypothetical protein